MIAGHSLVVPCAADPAVHATITSASAAFAAGAVAPGDPRLWRRNAFVRLQGPGDEEVIPIGEPDDGDWVDAPDNDDDDDDDGDDDDL